MHYLFQASSNSVPGHQIENTSHNPPPAAPATTPTPNTTSQQFINLFNNTAQQTIHPYVSLKFTSKTNNSNHTHYQYLTPDSLSLIQDPSLAPLRQIFLTRDITYFIFIDLGASSEKSFHSTVNKCKDTTPYAFYEWYTTCQAHCVCYGKCSASLLVLSPPPSTHL
eukprot:jgi/Psemu1/50173/gm1.50173_g